MLADGYIASFGVGFPNEGVVSGAVTVQISGDWEAVQKV
jgi:hypothetical protein